MYPQRYRITRCSWPVVRLSSHSFWRERSWREKSAYRRRLRLAGHHSNRHTHRSSAFRLGSCFPLSAIRHSVLPYLRSRLEIVCGIARLLLTALEANAAGLAVSRRAREFPKCSAEYARECKTAEHPLAKCYSPRRKPNHSLHNLTEPCALLLAPWWTNIVQIPVHLFHISSSFLCEFNFRICRTHLYLHSMFPSFLKAVFKLFLDLKNIFCLASRV